MTANGMDRLLPLGEGWSFRLILLKTGALSHDEETYI